MKNEELLILGAAGVAVWLILKGSKTTTPTPASVRQGSAGVSGWVNEIFSAAGTPYTNGWRYFENGVAIDPQGNYYQNGALVWSAPK